MSKTLARCGVRTQGRGEECALNKGAHLLAHVDDHLQACRSGLILANRTPSFSMDTGQHIDPATHAHQRRPRQDRLLPSQTVGTVPPSMTYSAPVMDAARGETRNAMRSATSSGFAGRPSGMPPSEFMMICLPPS